MRDVMGPRTMLGYCTNVHAGRTLAEVKANLERHACAVKAIVSPKEPMGVGLWLSAKTLREVMDDNLDRRRDNMLALREWLGERGLSVFTMNGFPYGDFHGEVVKHRVYRPAWSSGQRLHYTCELAILLANLLPEGGEGSISTLPVAWGENPKPGWADRLEQMAGVLEEVEKNTGKRIHLDLEPEPGCMLTTSFDVMALLVSLRMSPQPELLQRYLGICLDVCHQAVMFERPGDLVEAVRASGFRIGKVQLSSAVRAVFKNKPAEQKRAIKAQLAAFDEPRYLHQTVLGSREGAQFKAMYDDLPEALAAERGPGAGEWRVHFHVPLHVAEFGALGTTQANVVEVLKALRPEDGVRHFEVETYAWDVLPEGLREPVLAEGIAKEMQWVTEQACGLGLSSRG